jgi:hypothetical protein
VSRPPGSETNPYASPADHHEPKRARRAAPNRLAFCAFLLTLAPPLLVALAPAAWLVSPRLENVVYTLHWLLFLAAPPAVFAIALGIIGMQGPPSRYALLALLFGGGECLLILIGLLLTM